jgi:aromatic ring-cleaving dioxygenase
MGNSPYEITEKQTEERKKVNPEKELHKFLGTSSRQYHVHIYHGDTTEDQENALEMVKSIRAADTRNLFKEEILVQQGFVSPKGPHKYPQWEVRIYQPDLGVIIDFIMRRRKNNIVMIHPCAVEEYDAHMHDAFWWGTPKDLDEDYLRKLEKDLKENPDIYPM